MNQPEVTVLMSVYNGEKFLHEAIQSIINQTYKNYEFIIINDASNDHTEQIIKSFSDRRIRYFKNNENLGLASCLNKGILLSKGKYIARMDADDISMPTRLEKQVCFMNENPDCGVLGTWIKLFPVGKTIKPPLVHEEIYALLFQNNAIAHPSAILRTKVIIDNHCLFNPDFKMAQDYELWSRLIEITKFSNLPEILLLYRRHQFQISSYANKEQLVYDLRVKEFLYKRVLGGQVQIEFTAYLEKFYNINYNLTNEEFKTLIVVFEKAFRNVRKNNFISTEKFLLLHTLITKKAFDKTCGRSMVLIPTIFNSPYFWHSKNRVKVEYFYKIFKGLFRS